ncbi:hypothetical protein [Burkholderia sp. Bp8998]|uniref:hypothetical protein n=1 Tax=Burkholderia sp. Bp8998 TaxID=2184557 RepID=UPI00163ACD2F|nr:hypothetical protein [Burkholderia sp. Bp8998]
MKIDAPGGSGVIAAVDKKSTTTERPGAGHYVNGQSVIPHAAREARLYQRFVHIWEG